MRWAVSQRHLQVFAVHNLGWEAGELVVPKVQILEGHQAADVRWEGHQPVVCQLQAAKMLEAACRAHASTVIVKPAICYSHVQQPLSSPEVVKCSDNALGDSDFVHAMNT
eukprot:scaffold39499_cov17-Prasinocladus_malaysianus.AAC.1